MFPLALRKSDSLSEINQIKNPRDRLIYLLIKEIGLKVSEVSSLKRNNFSKNYLLLRNSRIELPDNILKTLTDYFAENKSYNSESSYLFNTRQGTKISDRRIQQILSSYGLASPSEIRNQCILKNIPNKDSQKIKTQFGLKSLREKHFLTKEEVHSLNFFLNLLNNSRDLTMSLLFLELGLTLNQVVNLEKTDIGSNSIKVKTVDNRFSNNDRNQTKVFPISTRLSRLLRTVSLSSNSNYVFSSRQGTKYSERRIQQIFDEYSSKTGFRITPQILRNTFVANKLVLSSKQDSHSKPDSHSKMGLHSKSGLHSEPDDLRKIHAEYFAKIRVYDGYHGLPKGETETT